MYSLASTVFIEIWRNAWVGQVREYSLSLFVRSSVFLLSIHAHAQRSPREKQSLDSHKNTTRLRGEIFGEKSSEHAGNIFFPSYYSLAHFMRYTLVRLNGVSRRIFFFPFSVFLTDGWLNFKRRVKFFASIRLINYYRG